MSAARKFLSLLCSSVAREDKIELHRENTGEGHSICAKCRRAVLPFTDHWRGKKAAYHDGCRPEGVVLAVTVVDKVNVVSETA